MSTGSFVIGLVFALLGGAAATVILARRRRRVDEERAAQAAFTSSLLAHTMDGIVTIEDGTVRSFNRAAERLFGLRAEEMVGKTIDVIIPGDHFRAYCDTLGKSALGGTKSGNVVELEGRRKDGRQLWIEGNFSAFPSAGRTIVTGVLRDITARRRAEEGLRRSQESFRALIESAPDVIFIVKRGRILFANGASVRLLGFARREELLTRRLADLFAASDAEEVQADLERLDEQAAPLAWRERTLVGASGGEVTVELTGLPLVFEGELVVALIARDLSERKELQTRLALADRMAAVGTLAAGVAHEINNPLQFIMSNLEFGVTELKARRIDGEAFVALQEALDGAVRVRAIVAELKSFSRVVRVEDASLDVRRAVTFAAKMTQNQVKYRARFRVEHEPSPPVRGNESRLGQVCLNLLLNAVQAIPEGAAERNEIVVRTGTDPRGWAFVEVSDTGAGIAAEDLGRIFDPFFSTKPVGAGTGLGLSVCHSIVSSMGGEIIVRSKPGEGATFRVCLPRDEQAPVAAPEKIAEVSPAPRSGRVLVVDDEPLIGASLRRILNGQHDVVALTKPKEALDRLLAGDPFDLILCDVMMPDLSGMDLYAELSRRRPDLASRVIFLTGGAFTPRARDFLAGREDACVHKPIDMRTVRELVRRRLEGQS